MTDSNYVADFSDLDEDMSGPADTHVADEFDAHDEYLMKTYGNKASKNRDAVYTEDCEGCKGSGRFTSWSGRVVGPCFKCKGVGKLHFKTSPEQRAKARNTAAIRKERKLAKRVESFENWVITNAAEYAFLVRNAQWSTFYKSLLDNLKEYGSLTDGQFGAVAKGMVKQAANAIKKERDAIDMDVVAIRQAFDTAIENATAQGKPNYKAKLRMLSVAQYKAYKSDPNYKTNDGDLEISRAPMKGQNAGFLYVKFQGEYVGKISVEGKFYKAYKATKDAIDAVVALNDGDMLELAVAYGKATSNCSCCGRFLENELSVELGIGPVCRAKWGWG
jgi:hypothetical protein